MMVERAMNFATIWYGVVNDLPHQTQGNTERNVYTAKCTGHLKSVDSILRSKARFAALDP